MRSLACAAVALALAAAISGCGAGGGGRDNASAVARTAASAPVAPGGSGTPAASNSADGNDATFCPLAQEKGAANLNVFDGSSTTPQQQRQVLTNIDDLTAAAPPEIHADFILFDTFEHSLTEENGHPDPALEQEAGGQELRDALTHISTYLGQHCNIHG